MPVEIKELVIRAVVDGHYDGREQTARLSEEATAELIESCVREVLRVLRQSRER